MTSPVDREFRIFQRGEIRDLTLQYFAAGLRNLVNPETNALFTEDEIASAIAPGSRWYRQAQAEDDYAQGEQHRALFMNDQLRIDRACTAWLAEYHARQWDPDGQLPATSGSGLVTVRGTDGVSVRGSATIGDPSAYWGRDPDGNRYQVYDNHSIGETVSGIATVTMVAMDPGAATNPIADSPITWANKDPGMSPQAAVLSDFSGGTDVESVQDWANRMLGSISAKQGAGNDAQHRAWAREASNSVEDAFVYPCAVGAGSVFVAVTQRRAPGSTNPTARIPEQTATGILATVTAYLTPPGSPVNPSPPLVVVLPIYSDPVNVSLAITMAKGSDNGWTDAAPFPSPYTAIGYAQVFATNFGAKTFDIATGDVTLPGQAVGATITTGLPSMLIWDPGNGVFFDVSSFVVSVHDLSTTNPYTYRVTLSSMPTTVNDSIGWAISPRFSRYNEASAALQEYFDERGPGNFVATTDIRAARCVRYPEFADEYPSDVGADAAVRVVEALEGTSINASVPLLSKSTPTVGDGVLHMLTLGGLGIYPL